MTKGIKNLKKYMAQNDNQFFKPPKIYKSKKMVFFLVLLVILVIVSGIFSLESQSKIFLYISWALVYFLAYVHGKIQATIEDGNLLREINNKINIIDKIKNSHIIEYQKILFEEKIKKLINR